MALPRFETARFNVRTGPVSLFERVRFKMRGAYEFLASGAHVQLRTSERGALLEKLGEFDSEHWRLQTTEVRVDKGKFVSSAWEVDVDGATWWVVIGFERAIKTVMPTSAQKSGLGAAVVTSGPFYDFVASVNLQLLIDDGVVDHPCGHPAPE